MGFSDPYDQQRLTDLTNQAMSSSYSGADVMVTIVMPKPISEPPEDDLGPPAQSVSQGVYQPRQSVLITGEMQTITVSSARSINPVRTLGTVAPKAHTRGARTIAGTMIFSNLLRDALIEHYQQGKEDGETDFDSFFVDQLPSFDIVITAANEHGAVANSVLKGVTISNFGTTMSIDDMYMESTYTYVAEQFWPFVADSARIKRLLSQVVENERRASDEIMSNLMGQYPTLVDTWKGASSYNANNTVMSRDDMLEAALKQQIEAMVDKIRNFPSTMNNFRNYFFNNRPSDTDIQRSIHGNRGYA